MQQALLSTRPMFCSLRRRSCASSSPRNLLQISAADQLSEADKQYVPKAMELLLGESTMNPDAKSPRIRSGHSGLRSTPTR
jgi:hypothetical protein